MALSNADLEALDRAIASGTLEVQFADRRVRYRSLEELLAARAHVEQQLRAPRKGSVYRFRFTTARE